MELLGANKTMKSGRTQAQGVVEAGAGQLNEVMESGDAQAQGVAEDGQAEVGAGQSLLTMSFGQANQAMGSFGSCHQVLSEAGK